MYCAVVAYPQGDFAEIESFREKYDPQFKLIRSHITIVFPFKTTFTEQELIKHLKERLDRQTSFPITTGPVEMFPDRVVHLPLTVGGDSIIVLHKTLYTDILSRYLEVGREYNPHITIGREQEGNDSVLAIARNISAIIEGSIDVITLVKIADDFTSVSKVKDFNLQSM